MRIFIIGNSRSGKSTIASSLSSEFGYKVISAGGWVREALIDKNPTRKEMDDYSCEMLSKNNNVCLEYIYGKMEDSKNVIIEGVRNPRDFIYLFEPGDIVIFIWLIPAIEKSEFERLGMNSMDMYTNFLKLHSVVNKAEYIVEPKKEGERVEYSIPIKKIIKELKVKFNGIITKGTN